MSIEFKSRAGKPYFIKSKLSKKGNKSYFMTTKKDDGCLQEVPDGYEVFEKPDMQVLYIRKIPKRQFSEEEVKLVQKQLEANKALVDFQMDFAGTTLKIYVAEKETDSRLTDMWENSFLPKERLALLKRKFIRFEERMRIIKSKSGKSVGYEFQRYCYRGSVDDWIPIDSGLDLEHLAKEYIQHLGRESYYDLFEGFSL